MHSVTSDMYISDNKKLVIWYKTSNNNRTGRGWECELACMNGDLREKEGGKGDKESSSSSSSKLIKRSMKKVASRNY